MKYENPRVDSSGNKHWTNEKGETHRDNDLPAVEYADGYKEWWINGDCYRENGLPAIEYANGDKAWYDENGVMLRWDEWINHYEKTIIKS